MKRCAVIGAGISGLTTAYYLSRSLPDLHLTLFDKSYRSGGVIRTEHIDGCIVEGGPDSFLTQKTAAAELCKELGLEADLLPSNDSLRKTWIFHDGSLKELPGGMFLMVPTAVRPFITSDLISWSGKFAVINDMFALPERSDANVADWVERRFGLEILRNIAEPLLAGVYGADVRNLSLKSALPQVWELQKRGSTVFQMMKRRFTSVSQQSLFTTLLHGMQSLTDALHLQLVDFEWRLNETVERIEPDDGGWRIEDQRYDAVVIASSALPKIQSVHGERIKHLMDSVRRNSAIVVALGYSDLRRDGFGWLVPETERRSVLACTYVSNKFSARTPPEIFLVRAFIGGSQALHWNSASDDEIIEEVQSELERIASIRETPRFTRIFRWPRAMPEYAVGHSEKINEVLNLATKEKNLFIAGNQISGVGIPDCIAYARKVAEQTAAALVSE